jgi:alkanesulfonate monooxygenase SsuD/methylene tetrahydromethanopterin reductase-like flavin-dependent oxidoreductase (luciferase family)
LREYIEVMRGLWQSGIESPVSYRGKHFRLEGAWLDQKTLTKPRICIGALGSTRMLNLIGTHGDAWLPTFLTPDLYRKKLAVIAEAARKAGRDSETIERIYCTYVVAAGREDEETIDVFIKNFKAFIATLCPFIAEAEGIRLPKMKLDTNYQRMDLTKEVLKEIGAQADFLPDSLVRKTAALGTPDEIVAYVEDVVKAGAQHVCFAVTRGRPEENLAVLKDKVLPYFRDSARR